MAQAVAAFVKASGKPPVVEFVPELHANYISKDPLLLVLRFVKPHEIFHREVESGRHQAPKTQV